MKTNETKTNEDIVAMSRVDEEKIKLFLGRNIDQIITEEGFWGKIRSGRKLRIKHGVDPTNPFLHLGHAVNYWKMREFQEMGHKIIFLIGDFTAEIGDPTGKFKARPELSKNVIDNNAKEYLAQATKILINKPEFLEVRKNSEWYAKMKLSDFLALAKKITHSRLIERDMFQKRIKNRDEIYMHELLYPILQGYDSVMVKSDLTIIGSDQLFNELVGRHYQEVFGQEPQAVLTTMIIPGLDGNEKMSKSLGNYIAIFDSARDKFGKIMTLPDKLVHQYFVVYTRLSMEEIAQITKLSMFDAKKKLAFEIVKLYHGNKTAKAELDYFEKTFSQKNIPQDLEIMKAEKGERWADFLVKTKLAKSKTAAKRLIEGGGIDFEGKKILKARDQIIKSGTVKIGKHRFIRIAV